MFIYKLFNKGNTRPNIFHSENLIYDNTEGILKTQSNEDIGHKMEIYFIQIGGL